VTLFQGIFVPLCLLAAIFVLSRLARGKISKRSGVYWFVLWATAALVIAYPMVTTVIARRLGIGRGADLVFYLAILGGVMTSLYFYVRFRRLEILVTDVMRREALADPQFGHPGTAAANRPRSVDDL
jgi:hypothetical protein